MTPRRIPIATYRLQLHAGFNLERATALIPYLKSLGISHVYTSSLLTAKPGSSHGYDVCDHSRLNPEIGTTEQFVAFSKRLKAEGMGLVIDVVPNHMSVHSTNSWWSDVLENGPSSPYSGHFDIVWNDHPREHLRGKVLLPILGTPYGEALDGHAFRLTFDRGEIFLDLEGHRLPIDPRTYGIILEPVAEDLWGRADDEKALEFQSIVKAIRHLPSRMETDVARVEEGRGEIAVVKRRLKDLTAKDESADATLRKRLDEISADPVKMDLLLEAQAYRPCYWRVASDEINYRRFFDVNDLAALSTENERVFDDVHRLIFEWMREGLVDGLRIDHPDGLFDPKQYLERLRASAPRSAADEDPYVVVEKILGPNEELRPDWATDGTTGYEFLNAVNGLFVDETAEARLSEFYDRWAGRTESFEDTVYRKKFLVLQSSMTSELHVLAGELDRLAQSDRGSRDFTLNGLRHALREVLCSFPIYRTYGNGTLTTADRAAINVAVRRARRRDPLLGRDVLDFVRDTLMGKDPHSGPATAEYRAAQIHFLGKFQQLSAPLMAKGFEDTALYLYNRLTSLNEVGGDPRTFGRSPAGLHEFLTSRKPGGLSPLSTHDTKRGEDVRARINVLSEWPDEWAAGVKRWSDQNRPHTIELEDGVIVPDPNEEYFLYQTLIGTWPDAFDEDHVPYVARIQEYMLKALHEAKAHSSWINPNTEYDAAMTEFIRRILDPVTSSEFLADFRAFVSRVTPFGRLNSWSQTLIHCTAPGVPDFYQGTERWDHRLVDPDNRQPVDFEVRKKGLEEWDASGHVDFDSSSGDGRIKLFVISRALRCRQRDPELFEKGEYEPLQVIGPYARNVFAYLRHLDGRASLTIVTRLNASRLADTGEQDGRKGWGDTSITMPSDWRGREWISDWNNRGRTVTEENWPIGDALNEWPVALFHSASINRDRM